MSLRSLLAATAGGTLLVTGLVGGTVHADAPELSRDSAGSMTLWGDAAAAPAWTAPGDLTALVVDAAASDRATAAVTADGRIRVWGASGASEVTEAPTDITDAVAVALADGAGAVIGADRSVAAWGSAELASEAPSLAAAVSVAAGTGYAATVSGGLAIWGADPAFPVPAGVVGDGLEDVSARPSHALALRRNGTVVAWGDPGVPAYNTLPALGGKKVVQIATGPGANGIVLEDGTIRVWGPAVPPGQPDLSGERVVSLDLGTNAGVITAGGDVYTWGSETAVNAVPASLSGQAVAKLVMGDQHAAAIVTYRTVAAPIISGVAQVGQTLTATPATHTLPADTITGQWYAGAIPIPGQTAPTLTVDDSTVGRTISFYTTAWRGGVSRWSKSAPTAPVARAVSTTTVALSQAKAAAGRAVTATATVSRANGTATGLVTFTAGTHTRTVLLSRGKATWTLPRLAAGTYPIVASYAGSPSTDASTSAPATLTVTKAASKVRASARANATRVRVAVKVNTDKAVSAVGKVIVKVAGRKATAQVDVNGHAVVTVKRVPRGTHKAIVTYAGNGSVAGSKGSVRVRS